MFKNTIEALRYNNYEGLEGVLRIVDITLATAIVGDVIFQFIIPGVKIVFFTIL